MVKYFISLIFCYIKTSISYNINNYSFSNKKKYIFVLVCPKMPSIFELVLQYVFWLNKKLAHV